MAIHSSVRIAGLVLVFAALMAPAAEAQDEKSFGIVAAFPGSIGFHWQMTDAFAVRVDGSYSHSTSEVNSVNDDILSLVPGGVTITSLPSILVETESHSDNTAFGITGLFTVYRREEFRLYVAPRFGVSFFRSKTTSTATLTGLPGGQPPPSVQIPRDVELSTTSPNGGASFGGSSRIGERFGVFGELGFNYTRSTQDDEFLGERTTSAVGTRASVGVTIFF
jgi:hypothetical protein